MTEPTPPGAEKTERVRYRPEGFVSRLDVDSADDDDTNDDAANDGAATLSPDGASDATTPDGADATPAAPLARWGAWEWVRWTWRQLTSMRVALLLLLLLAVAALPGAFLPQRPQDPARVAQYYADHPEVAPVLERFSLFDVYSSPWFAAIYLLLFVSLVGCIVPRAIDHARSLRQQPPRAPRRFTRFPDRAAFAVSVPLDEAVTTAERGLRGYRVRREDGPVVTLSAERGYLREIGNITFHLALVGLLVSVAYGSLVHYRGQVIVVEGGTFANSRIAYNSFDAGAWFDEESLGEFRLRLDEFEARFDASGAAEDFRADITVTTPAGERTGQIKVNEPLRVGGASVYLMGNGFAPRVEVHDGAGALVFSGAVPFIPQDNTSYVSRGVIKVPDTTTGTQIGLNGWFLPTAVIDQGSAISIAPTPDAPALVLDVWYGDLGLDLGVPQNVYQLDTGRMTQVVADVDDGQGGTTSEPVRVVVRPGETVELPEDLGTITFVDLPRFVGLDLRYDPTLPWVLGSALLAVGGLMLSLFIPRRRVFLRLGTDDDGRTVVTAAALARGDDPGLGKELQRVLAPLRDLRATGPTRSV